MSFVIAVAHSKGGTGKTTTSTQVADELEIRHIADIDTHQGLSIINNMRDDDRKWTLHDCPTKEDLARAIMTCRENNEPLLIDCGGFDSDLTRVAIGLSDLVITPANDDFTEQVGLSKFNLIIQDMNERVNGDIKAYVLMTRTHPSRKNFKLITDSVNKLPHLKMLKSRLSFRTAFPHMMATKGCGVTAYSKVSCGDAGFEVIALGKEIKSLLPDHF